MRGSVGSGTDGCAVCLNEACFVKLKLVWENWKNESFQVLLSQHVSTCFWLIVKRWNFSVILSRTKGKETDIYFPSSWWVCRFNQNALKKLDSFRRSLLRSLIKRILTGKALWAWMAFLLASLLLTWGLIHTLFFFLSSSSWWLCGDWNMGLDGFTSLWVKCIVGSGANWRSDVIELGPLICLLSAARFPFGSHSHCMASDCQSLPRYLPASVCSSLTWVLFFVSSLGNPVNSFGDVWCREPGPTVATYKQLSLLVRV